MWPCEWRNSSCIHTQFELSSSRLRKSPCHFSHFESLDGWNLFKEHWVGSARLFKAKVNILSIEKLDAGTHLDPWSLILYKCRYREGVILPRDNQRENIVQYEVIRNWRLQREQIDQEKIEHCNPLRSGLTKVKDECLITWDLQMRWRPTVSDCTGHMPSEQHPPWQRGGYLIRINMLHLYMATNMPADSKQCTKKLSHHRLLSSYTPIKSHPMLSEFLTTMVCEDGVDLLSPCGNYRCHSRQLSISERRGTGYEPQTPRFSYCVAQFVIRFAISWSIWW